MTDEEYYWLLGLATADGYIGHFKYSTLLYIQSTDEEIVQQAASLMGGRVGHSDAAKKVKAHYKRCYATSRAGDLPIRMISDGLSDRRKSYTQGPLDIPDEHFGHFLRGFTDGDGHIKAEPRIILSYTGGYGVLEWLKKELTRRGARLNIYDYRAQRGWNWVQLMGGGKNVIPAIELMYREAGPCLSRKRLTAEKILANR